MVPASHTSHYPLANYQTLKCTTALDEDGHRYDLMRLLVDRCATKGGSKVGDKKVFFWPSSVVETVTFQRVMVNIYCAVWSTNRHNRGKYTPSTNCLVVWLIADTIISTWKSWRIQYKPTATSPPVSSPTERYRTTQTCHNFVGWAPDTLMTWYDCWENNNRSKNKMIRKACIYTYIYIYCVISLEWMQTFRNPVVKQYTFIYCYIQLDLALFETWTWCINDSKIIHKKLIQVCYRFRLSLNPSDIYVRQDCRQPQSTGSQKIKQRRGSRSYRDPIEIPTLILLTPPASSQRIQTSFSLALFSCTVQAGISPVALGLSISIIPKIWSASQPLTFEFFFLRLGVFVLCTNSRTGLVGGFNPFEKH